MLDFDYLLLPTLDIYSWTEEHVYFWMEQIFGAGEGAFDMQPYPDLFKENHITGNRLLLLTEEDMRDMGIKSKGHIIHLKGEIEKLTNDYLGLFHFPPLMKDEGVEEEEERKVVNLELVFGYHWKAGSGPQDCKWKMYMELDGDEVAITYIKDVTFSASRPDVDVVKMTKPPFVMDKWIVGLWDNQVVDCVVNYESYVRSPKLTRHCHAVQWDPSSGQDDIRAVELVIQTAHSHMEGNPRSRSNSDVDAKWIYDLRQKHLRNQSALQHATVNPASGSQPKTLPQFLTICGNQDSYAAAVRKSPCRSPLSPWVDSRSSSPTSGISRKLSSVHLGSKGSSPSSTTSESACERERLPGAGSVPRKSRQSEYSLSVAGLNGRDRLSPTGARSTDRSARGSGERPGSHTSGGGPQNGPRVTLGVSAAGYTRTEPEETKASEGGWTKVERQKRTPRQDNKQVRGRYRRGGRGGVRRNAVPPNPK